VKTKEASTIGNALAGHSFRDAKHPKAKEYDNPLTDYMNLMIAQCKANLSIKEGVQ
jgi:hypothetical protein